MAMTKREGVLATIRGEKADRIPFVQEWPYLPNGEAELEARNRGLSLYYRMPAYYETRPNVKVTRLEVPGEPARIQYDTPVGSVSQPLHQRLFMGAMQGVHDYKGIGSYVTGGMVKKPEDYRVLEFIARDAQYEPHCEAIQDFRQILGEEGIVMAFKGDVGFHAPYTTLLIDWVGATRLFVDEVRHPELVEGVLDALDASQRKFWPYFVDAPSDIIMYGDHIDDKFISPKTFEKHILPFHNEFARLAHSRGRHTCIHCDGGLDKLKDLIADLEHDVIHAITPPPVGNLGIREALEAWPDKVLWVNYEYHLMGPKALKKHLLALLRSIIPGYRVIMDVSTERWVPLDCLRMFSDIMSRCTLPLTEQKVSRIEKSV
jgi:hypothetical protein